LERRHGAEEEDRENPAHKWWCFWRCLPIADYHVPVAGSNKTGPEYLMVPNERFFEQYKAEPSVRRDLLDQFNTVQIAAFYWELARRYRRERPSRPFTLLPFRVTKMLKSEQEQSEPVAGFGKKVRRKRWVYIPLNISPKLSFRLAERLFAARLREETRRLGIKRPSGPTSRTRPITWRWVDLMDSTELDKDPLVENDRKTLSEARKESKKQYYRIRRLLRANGITNLL
jgi:hypothetical protein